MTTADISTARVDSKGRILLPPDLRSELDLEPGDTVALKKTKKGLVLTPSKGSDYISKFKQLIETPVMRTGRPQNPSPSEMKKAWKETLP